MGYWLDSGTASLVFSGDTTCCDKLWDVVNGIENLKYLIIETAFGDADRSLAELCGHLCPQPGGARRLENLGSKNIFDFFDDGSETVLRSVLPIGIDAGDHVCGFHVLSPLFAELRRLIIQEATCSMRSLATRIGSAAVVGITVVFDG